MQVVLGGALKTDGFFGGFLNIALGYGLALMVGIILSGGVRYMHVVSRTTGFLGGSYTIIPIYYRIFSVQ